jgi:hypothetical protein
MSINGVTFYNGISVSGLVKTANGTSIGIVTTMPSASTKLSGASVLYMGTDGTNYHTNTVYECTGSGSSWTWTAKGKMLDPDVSIIQQGGTLTKPLKVTGGDQATAGKIMLDQSNKGQITDSSTATLFGFTSGSVLTIGSSPYSTALRGSQARPTWNGNNMALQSDVHSVLSAKAVSVAASGWSSNTSMSGYSYRASIAITGCTADHVPVVTFDNAQAVSGNYCPVAETYAGGVYIWSKVNTAITVPSVIVVKP